MELPSSFMLLHYLSWDINFVSKILSFVFQFNIAISVKL